MVRPGPSRAQGLLAAAGFASALVAMAGGVLYSLATRHELPNPKTTYASELEVLLQRHDYEAALPELRLAADIDFDSEDRSWQLLEAARAVNDLDDEQRALESLVQFHPDEPEVFYWLAGIYLKESDPAGAIAPASRAVELDPDNVNYRCRYGAALLGVERKPEAAEQYRAALEREPDCEPARLALQYPLKDF